MSDRGEGIFDSAQQAIKIERLEGSQALLAQQVRSSLDAMTSMLGTVQMETRALSHKMSDFGTLQNSQENSRSSIGELKSSVAELTSRLEDWFRDFEERNSRKWDYYEKDRNEWRLRHEAENEDVRISMEKEVRSVRETVIRAMGWTAGAGVLVAVVVSGFLWSINDRFSNLSLRFSNIDKSIENAVGISQYNRVLIDAEKDKMHEIELYLARGGTNVNQPYITKQQKQGATNERLKAE